MGYLDAQLTLSSGQSVLPLGVTVATNVIDLGAPGRDIGRGPNMRLLCVVGVSFASLGAATLTIQLVESNNPDLSGAVVLNESQTYTLADLSTERILLDRRVPITTRRYVGIQYVVAGAAFTAGTLTTEIGKDTNTPNARRVRPWNGLTDDAGSAQGGGVPPLPSGFAFRTFGGQPLSLNGTYPIYRTA